MACDRCSTFGAARVCSVLHSSRRSDRARPARGGERSAVDEARSMRCRPVVGRWVAASEDTVVPSIMRSCMPARVPRGRRRLWRRSRRRDGERVSLGPGAVVVRVPALGVGGSSDRSEGDLRRPRARGVACSGVGCDGGRSVGVGQVVGGEAGGRGAIRAVGPFGVGCVGPTRGGDLGRADFGGCDGAQ